MSISILEACRKRKRRPKTFNFHTFMESGCPMTPSGPFRDNVRSFLRECAELEDYNLEDMPIFCTLLLHETLSFVVPLYTIEEDVKNSSEPYCDQCRSSGKVLILFELGVFRQGLVRVLNWKLLIQLGCVLVLFLECSLFRSFQFCCHLQKLDLVLYSSLTVVV